MSKKSFGLVAILAGLFLTESLAGAAGFECLKIPGRDDPAGKGPIQLSVHCDAEGVAVIFTHKCKISFDDQWSDSRLSFGSDKYQHLTCSFNYDDHRAVDCYNSDDNIKVNMDLETQAEVGKRTTNSGEADYSELVVNLKHGPGLNTVRTVRFTLDKDCHLSY
ncbi:MAG: hypothetical protein ACXWP5_04220 [Bdellovibrionota bacterium]